MKIIGESPMTPLERTMATIHGKKVDRIPVVVPYIQYYLPYIINEISSFSWVDLFHGSRGSEGTL